MVPAIAVRKSKAKDNRIVLAEKSSVLANTRMMVVINRDSGDDG